MPDFLFIYHGGKAPETQAEIDATMAAWGKWMGDHNAALVDPGQPVGQSRTVSPGGASEGGGANPVAGYTIVRAADMDAACAIAKSNPMVLDGHGSVEVAEIIPIDMS